MDDLAVPKIFLDTALIIAALWAEDPASPGRRLFKMGEVGLVHLEISRHILRETEGVLKRLAGEDYEAIKVLLAENLALANVATVSDPNEETIQMCLALTNYRPDAIALAAALERGCEVFVTYDKTHLLQNPKIGPPNTRLVVMSGGEALDWAIDQVKTRARLRQEREKRPR